MKSRIVMTSGVVAGVAVFYILSVAGVQAQDKDHKAGKKRTAVQVISTQTVTIGKREAKFSCYLARPGDEKPAPGIVLIHEWWGMNTWVKSQADRFARLGYVALAVDLYHGEVAKDADHAHELMRGLADERAVADMKAAFDYLSSPAFTKDKPIGVIGWCMGGGFALRLAIAEARVACTVVCYGKPVTDAQELKKIRGPVLGIWGATDRGIEVEPFKKALDEAGVKATHHIYSGAGHAFLNETNQRGYNKEQARKAWGEIDKYLGAELARK